MTTTDEMTDAFTEVLDAAGARVCASCGSRALVRADDPLPSECRECDHTSADGGDNRGWFCFACGSGQRN